MKESFFDKRLNREVSVVKGEVMVRFKPDLAQAEIEQTLRDLGATVLQKKEALGIYRLRLPDGKTVSNFVREHSRNRNLALIEPNFTASVLAAPPVAPNDPSLPEQWGLNIIQAPKAWEVTTGEPEVVVAILDTGIELTHPDLKNKVVPGYDFVNGDADPSDDHGHGTHVAGIVAAEGNNGQGIAGVAWGSRLMPVRVIGAAGEGTYSDVVDGILFAADHGAKVLNFSIGGYAWSQILDDAVEYAHGKGALLVAAAGNDGTSDPVYPAACPNVIGVAATDPADQIWASANHGSHVRLCAPGTDILSTTLGNGYGRATGTSASAAHAAGVAALVFSRNREISNTQVEQMLYATADDLGASGYDPVFGFGRLNAAGALAKAATDVHDMAVTLIRLEPLTSNVAESVTVVVSVRNEGSFIESNICVRVTVNGIDLGSPLTIDTINPGRVQEVKFLWIPSTEGKQVLITAAAIPLVTGEIDWADNIKTTRLTVFPRDGEAMILYKNAPPVHGWIALQAFHQLPPGFLKDELRNYLPTNTDALEYSGDFRWPWQDSSWWFSPDRPANAATALIEGAWEEDVGLRARNHFWEPSVGPNAGLDLIGRSALVTAREWFQNAIDAYDYDADNSMAYYWLGRTAHLLMDMTSPAHVHLDWHADPFLTGTDAYEEFTAKDEQYKVIWAGKDHTQIPTVVEDEHYSVPEWSVEENKLAKLFYNLALFSHKFDSDDARGDSMEYGQGKFNTARLSIYSSSLPSRPAVLRVEWWKSVAGVKVAKVMDLSKGVHYDTPAQCEQHIYFYTDFWTLVEASDVFTVVYSDGTSDSYADSYSFYREVENAKGNVFEEPLKCIYQPQLEARAIGYVAALYQLFWARTHPDNLNPTATIYFPTGGTISGSVTVVASPSDNIGVTKVEFFVDGTFRFRGSSAPYSWSWNTSLYSEGPHTLVIKAYDAAGNVGTSPSVTVTVSNDTDTPTAAITSPTGGTVSGNVTVLGSASDMVGVTRVEFYLDGVKQWSKGTSPYLWPWTTSTTWNGSHQLLLKAFDSAGHIGTSPSVTVTVKNADTTPPVISAVRVLNTSSSATITWTTSEPANGQIEYGTSPYSSSTPLVPSLTTAHSITISGLSAATTYYYRILSGDEAGNLAHSADLSFRTTATPNTSPSVVVGSPNGGETWAVGSVQNIIWSAFDDVAVTSVALWYSTEEGVNPKEIASGLANSGSYAWTLPNTPTTLGRVFVWAYDAAGAMGADASDGNFIIAASCPTPAPPVLQPITVSPSGDFTVAWNPVSSADYYLLEESTTADIANPTLYNLTGTSRFIVGWPGTKYYRVRAVNTCGQSAPSNTRIASVVVDQSPGPISVVSPAADAIGQPLSVNLCWSCAHPGGESLRYNVYVVPADTEFFTSFNIKSHEQTARCFTAVNLPYNTKVSWGIVAIDDTGQERVSQIVHFTTTADTGAPTGTITINNGAASTVTYSVALYLTASDSGSGVMDMRFSNNGTTWSQWYPYATQFPWNVASESGGQTGLSDYTIYAQFRDYQLNLSAVVSNSITKLPGTPGLILCNGRIHETIQDAVNEANPGDTVYLTEGTFSVRKTTTTLYPGGPARGVGIVMRPGVRLIGAGAGKTIINMVDGYFGILDADNSFVQGIRIIGPSFPTSQPACILMASSNSVVQDCWLEGSYAGIQVTWNSQRRASDSRICGNVVRNNLGGLCIYASSANITVYNNTIVYNAPHAGFATEVASTFIRNNIIAFNSSQVAVSEGLLPAFQNNNVIPSAGDSGYQGMPNQTGINGNISADPCFVNAAANNFRLNAGSPAIDAGVNVGTPFAGIAPDMGAFEANAQGSLRVVSDQTNAVFMIAGPSGSYAGTGTNWTLSGLPAGIYSATFSGISNLYSPPLQVKTLQAGQTVTFDGTYSLDTVPPSGSVTVNYGEFATEDRFVTLTFDFWDEVAGMGASAMMKFSNDGTIWSPVEPYRTVRQGWDLCAFGGTISSGPKIVYAMACDALGNWTTTNTSILFVPDRRVLEVPTDYATIQAAVDAAIPGDVVHVAPGIFSENVTVAQGVTLLGSGPERTILTNQGCMFTLQPRVTVEGFSGSIYIMTGGPALIANNVLCDILMKVAIGDGRVIVRNNLFVNGPRGVQVNSASADALIENNTFVNLSHAAILLPNGIQGTHVEVLNNIFAFNGSGIADQNSDVHQRVFATYNTYWMNTNGNYSGSWTWSGASEVTADPGFVCADTGDFRLLDDSSCINTGQSSERYNDRNRSRNDRGAYGGPCLNTAPVAAFVATRPLAGVGTVITFDASSSFDRETENAKLLVRWDVDGDGQWDTGFSTTKCVCKQFINLGTFTVALEVRDQRGWISSTSREIRIENQPPVVPLALSVTNGARSQPILLTLDWVGGDLDPLDSVTYDVYFGTTVHPPLVASDLAQTAFGPAALSYNTYYYWNIVATDEYGGSSQSPGYWFLTSPNPVVIGRHIFYNNSAFDGNDPADNANDDGAIAPDKIALLPGQKATFANYSSYSKGINGIIVDISGLGGIPTADDFGFKVGNESNPAAWVAARAPSSITVRSGAGSGGSDRITIIWPDGAIHNQWVEVTVLATARTGLPSPDVFYFGNAIGETGDSTSNCNVLVNDALRVLNHMVVGVGIESPFDVDRSGSVLVNDALITLNHMVAGASALQLIDLGGGAASGAAGISELAYVDRVGLTAAIQKVGEDLEQTGPDEAEGELAEPGPRVRLLALEQLSDGASRLLFGWPGSRPVRVWRAVDLNQAQWEALPEAWVQVQVGEVIAVELPPSAAQPTSFYRLETSR